MKKLLLLSMLFVNYVLIAQSIVVDGLTLPHQIAKHKNYLYVKGRNKKYFIINQQKSKKFRGKTQNILINSKLNKVLNIWLKYNKSGNLLLDSLGKQMNGNQLTKALNVIFEDTGKKISSSMLRKIWLSDTYGETLTKMEESANAMGHSTGTAALHYIKK